jgi:lipoyl(octanoyl) transferase
MTPRLQIQSNLKSAALVRWEIADGMVDYEFAVARMEAEVAAIAAGTASELVWLVEHPALYTAGTSAEDKDLIAPARFPVYQTGRGGQYTYHGPGQRVAYVMLNLKRRGSDVRAFVTGLEQWIIATLDQFNIKGERREERVGVWVTRGDREDKIAALGIRLRHWVSYHGISINVDPDLTHFDGIVPCGINEHGVTSLVDLGLPAVMADLDIALKSKFIDVFGASQ